MSITTTKDRLLKNVLVSFYGHRMKAGKPAWYGTYELSVDGHTISGKVEYFENIDDAVAATKQSIKEAVVRFADEKIHL